MARQRRMVKVRNVLARNVAAISGLTVCLGAASAAWASGVPIEAQHLMCDERGRPALPPADDGSPLRTPTWTVQVVAEQFDAVYQDGRSLRGNQAEAAQLLADVRAVGELSTSDLPGGVLACFAQGSNPSQGVIDAVNQAIAGAFGVRYQQGNRWAGAAGSPLALTWSFVPDGLSISSGVGEPVAPSQLFSRMDTLFGGNRALWIQQFQRVFDRWAALTGLSYTRITATNSTGNADADDGAAWGNAGAANLRGDVRISMKPIDGTNGILAYNSFPPPNGGGDMVIDSQEGWNSTQSSYLFLRNVIAHEHGHGLGFFHVCPANQTKLMEPFISVQYDGPQQDDIRGVQASYGDATEPNSTIATAYNFGALVQGAFATLGNQTLTTPPQVVPANSSIVGLHAGDLDIFRFDTTAPRLANVTIRPVGTSYANYPQDQACNNNTINENALAEANLRLSFLNSSGTVIGTIDATPAGQNEVYTGLVTPTGTVYFRVDANPTPTQTQLYQVDVQIQNTVPTITASDGTVAGRVRVSWPAIPNAVNYRITRGAANTYAGQATLATIAAPAGATVTFDDTTAPPGQTFFYYVLVEQANYSGFRYIVANGSGDSGFRSNQAPVANAGTDITVTAAPGATSAIVTLNGSGSSDPDGTIASYLWQVGASTVLGPTTQATGQVAFDIGTRVVTLTVTDNSNATAQDTVTVTVNAGGPTCDSLDFNLDGDFPTPLDLEDFIAANAGNICSTCSTDLDFNNDGDFPSPLDVEAFISVNSGGPCL